MKGLLIKKHDFGAINLQPQCNIEAAEPGAGVLFVAEIRNCGDF
jgi:hypothetical protein